MLQHYLSREWLRVLLARINAYGDSVAGHTSVSLATWIHIHRVHSSRTQRQEPRRTVYRLGNGMGVSRNVGRDGVRVTIRVPVAPLWMARTGGGMQAEVETKKTTSASAALWMCTIQLAFARGGGAGAYPACVWCIPYGVWWGARSKVSPVGILVWETVPLEEERTLAAHAARR